MLNGVRFAKLQAREKPSQGLARLIVSLVIFLANTRRERLGGQPPGFEAAQVGKAEGGED